MALTEARRQQLVIALVGITRVASAALLGTVMAVYIGRRGNPFAVSLALTVFHFGLLFAAPLWGALGDVTGRRRELLFGTAVLSALSLVPLAFDQSVVTQIGIRGLYAVFAAGFGPLMLAVVNERGGAEGRGRSVGFYNSALSVGDIAGRLASGYLLGLVLPGEMYLVVVAVAALSALGVLFLTDPTPTPEVAPTREEVVAELRRRLLPAVGDRAHLRTNGLQWLYLALVLRNMTQKGVGSLVPFFLVTAVGVSEPTMGLLLAVSPVVRTVTMYGFGRVADRVGRKPLIAVGLIGAGVQAILLTAALAPGTLLLRAGVAGLGFVVHAVTFSALTTGAIAFIGDVAPPHRESELLGLRTTTRGVGGVLGPLVVGAVATSQGWTAAFLGSSVLAFAAAALVALRVTESHGAGVPTPTVGD